MAEYLNLPSKEQFDEINKNLRMIAGEGSIDDFENHPGPKTLLRGTKENGFYGFVQPSEMGLINDTTEYNGNNLALEIGLSSGSSFNSDITLMKFSRKGKVLFVPLTGYRYSVPWDEIYKVGAVYGTGNEGFLPPAGRVGLQLSIDSTDNSINSTGGDFLGDKTSAASHADTVAAVGDILVLKGWGTEENNKEVTVASITDNKIIVNEPLFTEAGNKESRFFKQDNIVTQNTIVTIGGKQYRVRLLKGAGEDPVDSYVDSDRGAVGPDNEWNDLILPLHERAKLGNWNYTAYAKNKDGGAIEDWGIGLTDENLRTHYNFGVGSYSWCQETRDDAETYKRVVRGGLGASDLYASSSWNTYSSIGWLPVLESI